MLREEVAYIILDSNNNVIKDDEGNTWATNYQPYNPIGVVFNKQ